MALIRGKQIAVGSIATDRLTEGSQFLQNDGDGFPMTVNMDLGNFRIVNLANGINPQDAATVSQVSAAGAGVDAKDPCNLASAVALGTWIAAGAGVGKTLTSPDNNLSNNDFDGVTASLNFRILILLGGPNANIDNGIYEVTQLADGVGQPTILTRTTDADEDSEVTTGMYTFVLLGTDYAGTGWIVTTPDPIVVDTDPFTFTLFTVSASLIAGLGLIQVGNRIDVNTGDGTAVASDRVVAQVSTAAAPQAFGGLVRNRNADGSGAGAANQGYLAVQTDNSTLQVSAANIVGVPNGGITETQLNTSVAGPGLIGGGGAVLEVNDGVGLEIVADLLRLAAQGNGIAGGAGSVLSVLADVITGGSVVPVNVVGNGVGFDIDLIDGAALVVAGAALAVNVAAAGGIAIVADALEILVNITTSPTQPRPSVARDAGGLWAATPVTSDKNLTPAPTAGDEATTGLTITDTPVGYVFICINGIEYLVGNGVKTLAAYFSDDGGVTALAFNAITGGVSVLYWNGVICGFNLDAQDSVSIYYVAV